jgi:putative transcriptional regulator
MKSLKGQLLVASRELRDPNFEQSVTLLFEHSPEGAAGFIVNRPTGKMLADLSVFELEGDDDWNRPIYLGGPVSGPLVAIHGLADYADQTVVDGIYLSADTEKIEQIVRVRGEPVLFVANYAGWGPGQLEAEFESESWLVEPATPEMVFWNGSRDLYEMLVSRIRFSEITGSLRIRHVPTDPNVN